MKVQNVKKECLAIVGLSVEFSNAEVSSLDHLRTPVENAIKHGKETAKAAAMETGKKYNTAEEVECTIDLESLVRIKWLLTQLTPSMGSELFDQADYDCADMCAYINNYPIPECKD
jgi:hypothetical protein